MHFVVSSDLCQCDGSFVPPRCACMSSYIGPSAALPMGCDSKQKSCISPTPPKDGRRQQITSSMSYAHLCCIPTGPCDSCQVEHRRMKVLCCAFTMYCGNTSKTLSRVDRNSVIRIFLLWKYEQKHTSINHYTRVRGL